MELGKDDWLVDSRASRHVTGDRNVFSNLELNSGLGASVQTAGNKRLPVQGSGNVKFGPNGKINIRDVYYVLGLSKNLHLVGKIVDEGYILLFDNHRCLVYDGPNVVVRGRREAETGLYRYIVDKPEFPICVVQSQVVP